MEGWPQFGESHWLHGVREERATGECPAGSKRVVTPRRQIEVESFLVEFQLPRACIPLDKASGGPPPALLA